MFCDIYWKFINQNASLNNNCFGFSSQNDPPNTNIYLKYRRIVSHMDCSKDEPYFYGYDS